MSNVSRFEKDRQFHDKQQHFVKIWSTGSVEFEIQFKPDGNSLRTFTIIIHM